MHCLRTFLNDTSGIWINIFQSFIPYNMTPMADTWEQHRDQHSVWYCVHGHQLSVWNNLRKWQAVYYEDTETWIGQSSIYWYQEIR